MRSSRGKPENETKQRLPQAIEFWSTVAEIEACLQEEDDGAGATSGEEGECKDFLARSASDLVPLLLELLLMQSEDQDLDDTDWCVATGALPLFLSWFWDSNGGGSRRWLASRFGSSPRRARRQQAQFAPRCHVLRVYCCRG